MFPKLGKKLLEQQLQCKACLTVKLHEKLNSGHNNILSISCVINNPIKMIYLSKES